MRAIYGPRHPFRDPRVEQAFWDFKMSCGPLLMNFASNIVAPKALKSREILDKAFGDYYAENAISEGSELAWARYGPPADCGLEPGDIAPLESLFLFAVLATSPPTRFWTLIEIRTHLSHRPRPHHNAITIKVETLKKNCPLLLSVFQETLRRLSIWSLFRIVFKDTWLNDQYFLKAGTLVLLPNHIIHNSSQVWGEDAMEFNRYRFMPDKGKHPATHFRTFGAAPNLCPGRHFATTEIISILCYLIMRFDLIPEGRNKWDLPSPYLAVFGAVMPPSRDVQIKLQPREGWQGEWSFDLGDPAVKPPLSTDKR